jgi:uncharacterized sulfatase
LYDTHADPDEVHNLAKSPEHAEVLTRMRQAHRTWEYEIKDVSFLPEWEMHERSKGTTPYEVGHDATRYDFDAVFAAAETASLLAPDQLPELTRLLNDDDSGVRYWAALGLLAQQQAGVEAGHKQLVASLADKSPIVQIVAAEALGHFGDDDDATAAIDVLLKYVGADADYYLAVAAWNALDYLDDRAQSTVPTLESLSTQHENISQRIGEYPTRLKTKVLEDLR